MAGKGTGNGNGNGKATGLPIVSDRRIMEICVLDGDPPIFARTPSATDIVEHQNKMEKLFDSAGIADQVSGAKEMLRSSMCTPGGQPIAKGALDAWLSERSLPWLIEALAKFTEALSGSVEIAEKK